MGNLINEHDETKNMLNLIREFNEPTQNIDDGEDANEQDFEDAKSSFMETVSNKVEFDGLKVYRNDRNAVFSGHFQDMGGMSWRMILNETDGLYVDANGLQLTQDTLKVLNALFGYYKNWSDEWGLKLNQDYKQKSNAEG